MKRENNDRPQLRRGANILVETHYVKSLNAYELGGGYVLRVTDAELAKHATTETAQGAHNNELYTCPIYTINGKKYYRPADTNPLIRARNKK